MIAGRPTLRDPEGEHELRPGDVVCFREGPEGAHQVRNDTDEPIRVLILSTKQGRTRRCTPTAARSGSGRATPHPGRLFRIDSEVDYWDGEA